jgi:hypothetical protein
MALWIEHATARLTSGGIAQHQIPKPSALLCQAHQKAAAFLAELPRHIYDIFFDNIILLNIIFSFFSRRQF